MTTERPRASERFALWSLILIHIVVCCVSLIQVAGFKSPTAFEPSQFHIFFDTARLSSALLVTGAFALVAALFAFARFSFGYFVGFYLYTVVLNYLWLSSFTDLSYDHRLAEISFALSMIAFLLPVLFMTAPVRRSYSLSKTAFDRLLLAILALAAATIAAGSSFNFRLASVRDIYDFRNDIQIPTVLNYLIGMTSTTLLPFAFAGFVIRKTYWGAAAALLLLLCLYPVTLTKLTLFAPFWLVGMLVLTKLFRPRIVVVLSLLVPILAALALSAIFAGRAELLFSIVNFRMIAIPSVALDVYSHFFSTHELTRFCQISFLKPLLSCPYQDQLAVVMERAYKIGSFNASLLATEGLASVGFYLAPVAVLACGFIVGIGNRLSAGLPAQFVLLSGAMFPQVLLNVPLSTALLTHGGVLLFLLWYITPPTIFPELSEGNSC